MNYLFFRSNKDLGNFQPQLDDIERSLREREVIISEKKDRMNTVEDTVFKDFCKTIGVDDIRQYEDQAS